MGSDSAIPRWFGATETSCSSLGDGGRGEVPSRLKPSLPAERCGGNRGFPRTRDVKVFVEPKNWL